MDRPDIDAILRAGLPNRFQSIDPQSFEDLIGQLFHDNDYVVEPTSYTRDYGADLIVEKDGLRTAVQVKRYRVDNHVGVSDLNQVIAAKEYYQCEAAMLITTSSFTRSSVQVSKQSQTIIWDWDRLLLAFEKTYCDGMSYVDYYGPRQLSDTDLLELDLVSVETHPQNANQYVVFAELTNTSSLNLQVYLDIPICLTRDNFQISSSGWLDSSFQNGTLFNEATVELAFTLDANQIQKLHKQDRIMLMVDILSNGQKVLLEEEIGNIKKGCFLTTYLYGLHSQEYQVLTKWRDDKLSKTMFGIYCIRLYYLICKRLLLFPIRLRAADNSAIGMLCQPILNLVVKRVGRHESKTSQ